LRSCYPRSPNARDLHPADVDLSVGAPDLGTQYSWWLCGQGALRRQAGSAASACFWKYLGKPLRRFDLTAEPAGDEWSAEDG